MPRDRQELKLADYVVLAINPALIMGMVGSLVLFLGDLGYAGQHGERLTWILCWFVFGAVLIARMSVMLDDGRAGGYGLVLGGLVWVGMVRYVSFEGQSILQTLAPLLNLFLLAIVWWSAHQLTLDCTHLDDEAEPGNEGLLQAAGVEPSTATVAPTAAENRENRDDPLGWVERWQRYRQERRRRRTPGAWIVYFSLAALPLFGLGQALLPLEEVDRRRQAFLMLGVYLASGLGLLLTTAFLGLRRYLRQRQVTMPARVTSAWLGLGSAIIVTLLIMAALLPRPAAEYRLFDLRAARSPERPADRSARKDAPHGFKDKDRTTAGDDKEGRDQNGKQAGKKDSHDKDGKQAGKKDAGDSDKKEKSSKGSGNDSDRNGQSGGSSSSRDRRDADSEASDRFTRSSAWLQKLAIFIKWIVFTLFALAVLLLLLSAGLKFLANFTDWARRWLAAWQAWWAGWFPAATEEEDNDESPAEARAAPFAAFQDPFADGRARRMDVRALTRYSLEALEALARDRGSPREIGETELEFTRRMGDEIPEIAECVQALGLLHVRVEYSGGDLPSGGREVVRRFWHELASTGNRLPAT